MATATKERKRNGGTGTLLSVSALKTALAVVGPAVAARGPKPVLQNVFLAGGKLKATDLEIQIETPIDYDGEPLLLPYSRLSAIVKESHDSDPVRLIVEDSRCTVKIGRGEWVLPIEHAAEFPSWNAENTKSLPVFPCDQFSRAITSVLHAVDQDSARFALGAIHLEVSRPEEKCWFVATDGRRLSVATIDLPHSRDVDDAKVEIPKRAMSAILEIAKSYGKNGDVELCASKNELVATFENHRVLARLADGQFPRWADAIPKDRTTAEHKIGVGALLSGTRAAAIVTSEQSKGVRFAFLRDGLVLTAKSSEAGESTVQVDIEDAGHVGTVILDPRFVGEVLSSLQKLDGEPTVRVSIDGKGDAVLFSYGEDDEYRSVIMPLNVE